MDEMTRARPVVQLARSGLLAPGEPALLDLAHAFVRHHAVVLPQFIGGELWNLVIRRLRDAHFDTYVHADLDPPSVHLTLADEAVNAALHLLMNDPALHRVVEQITGCDPIGCWIGQFYRMCEGPQHADTWHDDYDGNRMVAITVNFTERPFAGGALTLRAKADGRELWTYANVGAGDAVLFRLDRSLEHIVHPVTGAEPKSALAGWFCRTPRYWQEVAPLADVDSADAGIRGDSRVDDADDAQRPGGAARS